MIYFIVLALFIAWGTWKAYRFYHIGYKDGYTAGEAAMLETLSECKALKEHPVNS